MKRKKKKKYADGETLTPSGPSDRSAASGGVDRELDLPPAASGSLIPRRSRVEFPDQVEFSYSGDTPLIYDPPKCAELVRQIRCGLKGMPATEDL